MSRDNELSTADTAKASQPVKIVVAVLTYRRPEGISKLLDVLTRQHQNPARPYALTVLVVDNDAAGSGWSTIEPFISSGAYAPDDTNGQPCLKYCVEKRQGIPFARNRALDEAPEDTDLFCFLDDDEWPVDHWLDAMLDVREATSADCVYGPVEPVYPEQAADYFIRAGVFERKRRKDREQINYAASNNVMFDYRLFRRLGLRFEERMRYTGGTDFVFFNQAVRIGVRIFWADAALVYDIVPASRMKWKWVLQRQYRLGNTFAVAEKLYGNRKSAAYRFAYGAARVGLGTAMLPALAVSPRLGMRALTHLLRGAGTVSGLMGHAYEEYRPDAEGAVK
ncbi:glycosyltransferase family 2 protein [Rhizobium sp. 22-785-1]